MIANCEAVGVVDEAGILQSVNLVEDDGRPEAIVLLEAVDEFTTRRRLPVNVNGDAEVVEDLVGGAESSAVHVSRLDVKDLLPEPFGDEL